MEKDDYVSTCYPDGTTDGGDWGGDLTARLNWRIVEPNKPVSYNLGNIMIQLS